MSYKKQGNPLSGGTHTTPKRSTQTQQQVKATKSAITNIGKTIANTTKNNFVKAAAANINQAAAKQQAKTSLYNSVVDSIIRPVQTYNSAAAALANEWSNTAQQQAATYNQATMDAANAANQSYLQQQMDYNKQAAADANAFNQAMWEQTAAYNSAEAQKNRDFSAQQAQIQREWQEKMAGQAIQTQMKDLKAAGVNPILAASYGGANFGSGAAASGSTAQMSGMSAATANAALQSSPMASISGFQGIMENTYSDLSKLGLIAQVIGNAMDAMKGLFENPMTAEPASQIVDAVDNFNDWGNVGKYPFNVDLKDFIVPFWATGKHSYYIWKYLTGNK